ncbi:tape measure protein, partial [Bacillus paralicheniformis]|uniref:tape measure protein n=1 Tax=Bacillus paralicheniformis TaxID=1648923 RepID=UPI0020C04D7F
LNVINTGLQTTEQPLSQAMGSGNLQGQDLNNVFQSTSNAVHNTTNYLNAFIQKLREIASSGEISMPKIRNAV